MVSEVDICNAALDINGAGAITSLIDNSRNAILCNRNYSIVRDRLLREHNWNFTKKRAILAKKAGAPLHGFLYCYGLPADYMRFAGFENDPQFAIAYSIENEGLLTDNETANINYHARITDVTLYDSMFIDALIYELAATICYAMTGNRAMASELAQKASDKLKAAMAVDSQDGLDKYEYISSFVNVRY